MNMNTVAQKRLTDFLSVAEEAGLLKEAAAKIAAERDRKRADLCAQLAAVRKSAPKIMEPIARAKESALAAYRDAFMKSQLAYAAYMEVDSTWYGATIKGGYAEGTLVRGLEELAPPAVSEANDRLSELVGLLRNAVRLESFTAINLIGRAAQKQASNADAINTVVRSFAAKQKALEDLVYSARPQSEIEAECAAILASARAEAAPLLHRSVLDDVFRLSGDRARPPTGEFIFPPAMV